MLKNDNNIFFKLSNLYREFCKYFFSYLKDKTCRMTHEIVFMSHKVLQNYALKSGYSIQQFSKSYLNLKIRSESKEYGNKE